MRLLVIAEKYPPIVGGGETQLAQLATGLVKLGYDVTVATDRTGVDLEPDAGGVRVVHVPGLRRACQGLDCREAVENVYRLLTTVPHDAVHVVNYVPALLLVWLRSAVRAPIFVSLFETVIPDARVFGLFEGNFPLEDTLRRSVSSLLAPRIVFCGSEVCHQWALDAGFEPRTLRVIAHATEIERFTFSAAARDRYRGERRWTRDEFVFLVPARPVPRKRIEDVLAAAAELRRRGRRIRVAVTAPAGRGDPAYLERLRHQIARDGIEAAVSWEPDLAWTDMPALYSACDAVVLPSSHEGFGVCLIEAMAASRPVVVADIPGPNGFVSHGVTGYLYPPGDIGQLVKRMILTMDSDTWPTAERALRLVEERYAAAPMLRCYADLFEEHCRVAS